jgi:phosphoenolpyruvate carboxylase
VARAGDESRIADAAVEGTIERIRELNERAIEGARQAGSIYLDAYEQALKSIVEQQERLAEATPVEWVRTVIEAQAEFTREMGNLYASAVREAFKT